MRYKNILYYQEKIVTYYQEKIAIWLERYMPL